MTHAPVDFSKWSRETLNQYATEAMRRLIEQDEELSRLRREPEALRDMLDSVRADMEVMREALGVPVEPHQSLMERMVEAAQARRGCYPQAEIMDNNVAPTFDVQETYRAMCAIGVVGLVGGRDVIFRESALDVVRQREPAIEAALRNARAGRVS